MAQKKFRETRLGNTIVIWPVLYILTTIVLVVTSANVLGYLSVIPLLMMIAGYPVGSFLSRGVTVRSGILGYIYYKGSAIILLIWIFALIAKAYIFLLYPTSVIKDLSIDILVGFFAGILVGGTSAILRNAFRFVGIEEMRKNL